MDLVLPAFRNLSSRGSVTAAEARALRQHGKRWGSLRRRSQGELGGQEGQSGFQATSAAASFVRPLPQGLQEDSSTTVVVDCVLDWFRVRSFYRDHLHTAAPGASASWIRGG